MYGILTHCPLFRGLSAARIEELLDNRDYSVSGYSAGEVIAHKDTAYSGLMIILEGKAVGVEKTPQGGRSVIDNIEAPQLIAPAFLFGGFNRLPIDVVAESDVKILTLHRGLIFELMQENVVIMSNFIDIISNRANMLFKRMYFLSFKTVKEKLANYLSEHSSDNNPSLDIGDLSELSELFNVPRNSISEVLKDLIRRRVISYSGGVVTVLDRVQLNK